MTRSGVLKRVAGLPREADHIQDRVSKSDLMEAAWHLAALCNDAGSAEDLASTRARLIEELNLLRENRGLPRFSAHHFQPRGVR